MKTFCKQPVEFISCAALCLFPVHILEMCICGFIYLFTSLSQNIYFHWLLIKEKVTSKRTLFFVE